MARRNPREACGLLAWARCGVVAHRNLQGLAGSYSYDQEGMRLSHAARQVARWAAAEAATDLSVVLMATMI